MTAADLNQLTDGEMGIAIAELCGWRKREPFINALGGTTQEWERDGELTVDGCVGHTASEIPDYLNSLDDMASAEETLTDDALIKMMKHLCGGHLGGAYGTGFGIEDVKKIARASAKHRALAFLAVAGEGKGEG